jgi:hypothetical protein
MTTDGLADVEAAETLRLLVHHVDALDLSAARALPAERDQPLNGVVLPFEDRLDRPVPAVRDPAGDGVLLRETA